MDKEKILQEINSIVNEYGSLSKQRNALEERFREICPIKAGDKVSIVNRQTDEHIRFAFIRKVELSATQSGEGIIVFRMDKCKKDGSKSEHNDYLGYNEAVKRIG